MLLRELLSSTSFAAAEFDVPGFWKAKRDTLLQGLPGDLQSAASRADKFVKQEPNPDEKEAAKEAGHQFYQEANTFLRKWNLLKSHLEQFPDRHDRLRKFVADIKEGTSAL
ncbi:unnamed protein product [Amoebophrya sp. A120]|nr:unnamed protein product [Amoebophrya sp. A120]|eukprot:GSA120T00020203001.1